MKIRHGVLAIAGACIVSACGSPDAPPEPAEPPAGDPAAALEVTALPDVIVVERGGFIPEGIAYDRTYQRILVGSMVEGTVFEVDPDGGLSPVVEDEELHASVGIRVDEPRNRLLVTNSDPAVFQGEGPGRAMLGVYDLASSNRLAMVDLTEAHEDTEGLMFFANDVVSADDGTVYVTDSFARVIYAVDIDYAPSILLPNQFADREQFMWNGLVHHGDGYLLVAETMAGALYRIPLDDPEDYAEVSLPEPIQGADGLIWHPDGRLVIVSNSQERVVALRSDDGWDSAVFDGIATYAGQATTAAAIDEEIYIIQPHFQGPDQPTIERVTFE